MARMRQNKASILFLCIVFIDKIAKNPVLINRGTSRYV